MAELFDRDKSTISRHIKNLFDEGELQRDAVVANFATTAADGKIYQVDYSNSDNDRLEDGMLSDDTRRQKDQKHRPGDHGEAPAVVTAGDGRRNRKEDEGDDDHEEEVEEEIAQGRIACAASGLKEPRRTPPAMEPSRRREKP